MKKIYLLSLLFLTFCSNVEEKSLHPVTVKEFKEFINATGYETDAERYGWSIVQLNVYDYKIINGATWLKPDGENTSEDNMPVTQVSYKDAIEYCKWAGVSLPTYEQYWKSD